MKKQSFIFCLVGRRSGPQNGLREVLTHYRTGISESATLAPELSGGVAFTSNEATDLVAFLLTLTDKEFLFNRDFAFPR